MRSKFKPKQNKMKEKNNNNKRKKLVWGVPFKVYVVQAAGDALAA